MDNFAEYFGKCMVLLVGASLAAVIVTFLTRMALHFAFDVPLP